MAVTWTVNWWALLLRGIAAVLFGILAFIWPGITVAALVLLFGVYALVDGIFAVVAAVRGMTGHERWWPLLIKGIVGILAGVLTFAWPGITALALLLLIAAWAIVTGVFEIVAGVHLRRVVRGEWMLILGGVLSVILGIFLAAAPGVGLLAVIWWIGAYALVFGVLMIVVAFRLRSHYHGSITMNSAQAT